MWCKSPCLTCALNQVSSVILWAVHRKDGYGAKTLPEKNGLHLDVRVTWPTSAKLCPLLATDSRKEVWRHLRKASLFLPSWQGAHQLACRWHGTVLSPRWDITPGELPHPATPCGPSSLSCTDQEGPGLALGICIPEREGVPPNHNLQG